MNSPRVPNVVCHSCRRLWGLLPVRKGALPLLLICAPCGYQNNVEEATRAAREETAKQEAA